MAEPSSTHSISLFRRVWRGENGLWVALLGFVLFGTAMTVLSAGLGTADTFGADVVIPPDMVVEAPVSRNSPAADAAEGGEHEVLRAAIEGIGTAGGRPVVQVNLAVLDDLAGGKRTTLFRHLATSAKWFVSAERGKLYAQRRFHTGNGGWTKALNGFYGGRDFDAGDAGYFQMRVVVGLDGPAMARPWRDTLTGVATGRGSVLLGVGGSRNPGLFASYLVVRSSGPAVEIFEEHAGYARPLTSFALSNVEAEFTALLNSQAARTRGFDPALMPAVSIRRGPPGIYITDGRQGGIYEVYAQVNSMEAGYVYLRAFEATRGTPLSAGRLPARSLEYIGWSDDPGELFSYNSLITIYEGSWDVHYPARFELWFVPSSGGPERKLVEKIFRIEGWQR